MYRHVLVPIDCSQDTRLAAPQLAQFLSTMVPCQVTLVAVTSPAAIEEERFDKMRHARQALHSVADVFTNSGVYTRQRLVENTENGDMATALKSILNSSQIPYDLILLASHNTRQEEFDLPCPGSVADRICSKVNIPVLVLPTRQRGSLQSDSTYPNLKDLAVHA